MARRKKKSKSAAGRRGGRKPGRWELLTPAELLAFRKQHGFSRAKLAEQLGVSTTSIQNWETGRAASLKIQKRLRDLIDGKGARGPAAQAQQPNQAQTTASAIETTGSIVSAYLANQKTNLPPAQLAKLVRSVRVALS